MTLLLFSGAALSLGAEGTLRPALLVAYAAMYAATGFFAFFYALLFMAGSTWRRLAMLLFVLLLLAGQIALHIDAAQPRELMVHDEFVSRSASVEHLMAAAADAVVALLLLLHGCWLAFGSRPRFPGQEPSIFAEPEHVNDAPVPAEQGLQVNRAADSADVVPAVEAAQPPAITKDDTEPTVHGDNRT